MKYFHQFIVIICNPKQLYYSLRKKIVTLFKEMKFFLLFSLLKIRADTFGIRAMILGQTFFGVGAILYDVCLSDVCFL
jgi:hypothetical protein